MQSLQTLERGFLVLETIAKHQGKLTIAQLAQQLEMNRTVIYRLVHTLVEMGYVHLPDQQHLSISAKILPLYRGFEQSIPAQSQTVLEQLSEQTQAVTAMVLAEGNECVVVKTACHSSSFLQLSYRLGTRHPIGVAAAGIAIACTYPEQNNEEKEIQLARQQGYAFSQNVLQLGAVGLFIPVPNRHLAIGTMGFHEIEIEKHLPLLKQAALNLMF
ncbi:helix-turn-helix domain-containing protein [Acinetobacter gerneri]|uniref:Helix-turn-helix domain-containing protein n=1 Tax=Acinetobacter gerneri TaxID=202952 RepID=A0AAW8JFL8_9GAMM|nr:helix-turn-helix domain-containing protein [Acinetobacter gerneri]MDQ9008156.1 helix-turn-helix domain-containing protein [Acinetobacter gerneri]MDQ9012430.1 helix-turn-helix domain-containing protein [Acinetobacter gerneri]MDQ9023695.1 helix-turn-helix domain-containing protein [Acinetobacter gerneri]MDQ9051343.1 helix-turn-helix domain-containing protein [Acinetobacter gerneri]MDQ9058798.1 helix-turn-helix domain-containing protein [Acinetobacter gerneri]